MVQFFGNGPIAHAVTCHALDGGPHTGCKVVCLAGVRRLPVGLCRGQAVLHRAICHFGVMQAGIAKLYATGFELGEGFRRAAGDAAALVFWQVAA